VAKYLRRRRDGMIFGFSADMARNTELEVVDIDPEQVAEMGRAGGDGLTQEQITIKQLGLTGDALQGYPHKGYSTNPLAPYGTNPPQSADLADGMLGEQARDAAVAVLERQKQVVRDSAKVLGPELNEIQRKTLEQIGDIDSQHSSSPAAGGAEIDVIEGDPTLAFGGPEGQRYGKGVAATGIDAMERQRAGAPGERAEDTRDYEDQNRTADFTFEQTTAGAETEKTQEELDQEAAMAADTNYDPGKSKRGRRSAVEPQSE
jgi:hypothetical protein